MEYNTQIGELILPEYGRHIQKMVVYCCELESKEERNKCARAIIDVMGNLIPQLRDVADFKHKLWDHLFIMSDFKLNVDSPYPIPDKELLQAKPKRLSYPKKNIRYKHYGRGIENLIEKCIATENLEEQKEFTEAIANLMKKTFLTWNRDSVNDEVIVAQLTELSKGKLILNSDVVLRSTKDILGAPRANPNANPTGGHQHKSGGKKKFKRF